MLEIGTRIFHKQSKQNGVIRDLWNHEADLPVGYLVVTDDGIHHVCLEEDFEIVTQ